MPDDQWCVCLPRIKKYVKIKNATQEENRRKKAQRPKTDVPQIQKWEILQKDDASEWQMPMPVREQKGGRGWFSWLFGTKTEIKETKGRPGRIELNVSDRDE